MRNLANAHMVVAGEFAQGRTHRSGGPNFPDQLPCQLGHRVLLSREGMRREMVFTLRGCLAHVRELVAKLQVPRIAALWVWASWANVVHLFAFWNRATPKNPRSAMGVYFAINSFAPLNHPMATRPILPAWSGATSPKPASVEGREVDLAYEAQRERRREFLLGEVLVTKVHLWNKHSLFRSRESLTGRSWHFSILAPTLTYCNTFWKGLGKSLLREVSGVNVCLRRIVHVHSGCALPAREVSSPRRAFVWSVSQVFA